MFSLGVYLTITNGDNIISQLHTGNLNFCFSTWCQAKQLANLDWTTFKTKGNLQIPQKQKLLYLNCTTIWLSPVGKKWKGCQTTKYNLIYLHNGIQLVLHLSCIMYRCELALDINTFYTELFELFQGKILKMGHIWEVYHYQWLWHVMTSDYDMTN